MAQNLMIALTLLRFHFYPFLFMKTQPVTLLHFQIICYENDRRSHCSRKAVLLFPFSKQCLLLIIVIKTPMATLNAIVISSLLTKEYAAFSNVSVFGVHTENGSFSKRTVLKSMRFH